ncbi:MAG TPA: PadR family transcriptional regulator [Solirubrobacterales bacterium]|jgi:DNA-binding PadR family transcriptional regulator
MDLNPTSYVILGMLGLEPMCGYEIKRFVDDSTRFFWAASYGQIYPELRRLSEAGLIEGKPDPSNQRKRIEFSLTPAGRAQLERWLAAPAEVQEMRDESLLKVFFSGAGGPDATRAALEAKRDHHRAVAGELRAIEASKAAGDTAGAPETTLRFGIAFNDFVAEWCDREATAKR